MDNINQNQPGYNQPNQDNQNQQGFNQPNPVNQNQQGYNQPNQVNQNQQGYNQLNPVNQNQQGFNQPNQVNQNQQGYNQPNQVNQNQQGYNQPNQVNQNQQGYNQPNQVNQNQQGYNQPNPVNQNQQNTDSDWNKVKSGGLSIKNTFHLLIKKPITLLPLFICWIILAIMALLLKYYIIFPKSIALLVLYIFIIIFIASLILCFSNLILLELMKQVEETGKTSFANALKKAFSIDIIKAIPLSLILAIVWFIVSLIKLISNANKSKGRSKPTLESSAMAIGGISNNPFTWLKLGLDIFQRLVMMIIFLALPSIAWENKGSFSSLGNSFKIIKQNPIEFITTYSITGIIGIIMAIPLAIFLYTQPHIGANNPLWIIVIIYEGIVWTLSMYIDQVSLAFIYIWHLNWVKNGSIGSLSSFQKPNITNI